MLDRVALEEKLADEICLQLQKDIEARGQASLLVSGGSTPKALFNTLSQRLIDWQKVVVSLVDERFLPDGHSDQNGELVKAHLLQNEARKAEYQPMVQDAQDIDRNMQLLKTAVQRIKRPFSVVILGMGGDGHTASLFPESPQLDAGMAMDQDEDLLVTDPVTAPYQRITFTRKALLHTHRLFLHCYGEEKQQILTHALQQEGYLPYPIGGFNGQDGVELEVFWTK
jgi:6-phosphogluconolactonase